MFKRMIQRFIHFLKALVYDDVSWTKEGYGDSGFALGSKAVAKIRAVLMLGGLVWAEQSQQIIDLGVVPQDKLKWVKFAGYALVALGAAMRAGDKNPPPAQP